MVTAFEVETNKLIAKTAEKLKEMKIEKPDFIGFVKTGAHAERPPEQADFWYVRCASILRQAYFRTTIGVNKLRRHYGGRVNRGVRPEHRKDAGGKTIRNAMQALEKIGLIEKTKKGRNLTAKGRKFLDNVAKQVS